MQTKPRTRPVDKYALAEYEAKAFRNRVRRAFIEMMRDKDSKYHGGNYSTRSGCPCRCLKCMKKRREYLDSLIARNRRYAARMEEEDGDA